MADNTSVDLARVSGDNPVAASPDLLRAMVQAFAEALMGVGGGAAGRGGAAAAGSFAGDRGGGGVGVAGWS